jgi:hypothetical protein
MFPEALFFFFECLRLFLSRQERFQTRIFDGVSDYFGEMRDFVNESFAQPTVNCCCPLYMMELFSNGLSFLRVSTIFDFFSE